ncbi:MAG: glycogen/starch/alpha-glucan phosphorylase [Deltaproteobacteria bacterium]|nr:glycogen/starch/alpha-glucan phosphorylase [Deltaproteobacteria bacterium]
MKKMRSGIRAFQQAVDHHIRYSVAKRWDEASAHDRYKAVALAVRDRIIDGMLATQDRYQSADVKRLYYLSMEFLMGRALGNNLYNLGVFDEVSEALTDMGVDLEEIRDSEIDAALGNGGLGRLAACFLDSLAMLGMPGFGYGINYEFGIFKQVIDNGYQKEKPDRWHNKDNPWLIERPDEACIVPVYGKLERCQDAGGSETSIWGDWKILVGVPHDMPVVGYGGGTVNYLRLFSARSSDEFDMQIFNEGDYFRAVEQKISSETISKVLYPSDSVDRGKELRLVQEYFLVACSIRDIMRRYLSSHETLDVFPDKVAIQLNDTHPALAVPELMRTLVDENDVPWDRAWEMTEAVLGYTNHTLLPEALEKWPVPLLEHVLPRHLELIYEINQRFLDRVSVRWPGDGKRLQRMSIIEEGDPKHVRMAHLSIIGSHSVNGVAKLHSELVKSELVPDFYAMWPEKFNNKTNGVTQRRWLLKSNPLLSSLISETIGDAWITDADQLAALAQYAEDRGFHKRFLDIKRANKERLAKVILDTTRVEVNPGSLFDVQVKRIHEYKRQLLNVLQVIHGFLSLVEDGRSPKVPKTYIFSGKAAPGYFMAKLIIKLICSVGEVVNNHARAKDHMKVVLIPDYRVSLAEKIIPAADVSEQISTAGMEASGTGNMKLAMNGAVTIGTLDGANVEILEEVGPENIYIFGLNVDQVREMRRSGTYDPRHYYEAVPGLKRVLESLVSGLFSPRDPELFRPIYDALLNHGDYYLHLADFQPYLEAQTRASEDYADPSVWAKKAILNVARTGRFSSDRTIREYADQIWGLRPALSQNAATVTKRRRAV